LLIYVYKISHKHVALESRLFLIAKKLSEHARHAFTLIARHND